MHIVNICTNESTEKQWIIAAVLQFCCSCRNLEENCNTNRLYYKFAAAAGIWRKIVIRTLSSFCRSIKKDVGIIQIIQLAGTQKEGSIYLFMDGVPPLDINEKAAPGQKSKKGTKAARPADLPMYILILDETADLTIKHPVELGSKNNVIAKMPMLAEEGEPASLRETLPLTGIEYQLRLIND